MPSPSCISVTLVKGRSGTFTTLGGGSASDELTFRVVYDGVGSTAQMAMQADDGTTSVPAFGEMLGNLMVTTKTPRQREQTPLEWEVGVSFTLPQPGQESKPDDPEIEKWAIVINGDAVPTEVEIQKKPDGSWISNTAGDLLSGVMEAKYDEEISIEYAATTVPFTLFDGCKGRASNADITFVMNGEEVIYPTGTLKLDSYGYSYTRDVNGEQYPRIRLRLLFRAEGWVRKVPNLGFRVKTDDGPVVIDRDAPQPFPLNADGDDVLEVGDEVLTVDVPTETADFTDLLDGLNT